MLNIGPGLTFTDEAVTQTFAILAKRGMGKTYTASVMVEEMLEAKLPVIVIDPIGVWWGLRTSADGKSKGLEIVIAGGEHADVPIQPDGGEILADFVVETGVPIIIDISLFRKGEQHKFVTDFAETLYRRNRNAVHLVLDEADEFAPQRPMPGEARMLGAIEDLVRRGRARGIGVTMITQRAASINKNVLTQIEVLIAMRMTGPPDQKAVDEWIKTHAEAGQRDKFMNDLPSLPIGVAWFWSPGWLDIFQKVHVRKRHTFDSSSTPKAGTKAKQAKVMADVDLAALRAKLAATIEKVEAEDPKALRRQVAELKKQLAGRKPQVEVREVVKEVVPDHVIASINMVVEAAGALMQDIERLKGYTPDLITDKLFGAIKEHAPKPLPKEVELKNFPNVPDGTKVRVKSAEPTAEDRLSRAARALLNVLADFYPQGRTKKQLSILSGYSKKSSSFSNALGELRAGGYISPAGVDPILATPDGVAIADNSAPVPRGQELVPYWRNKLGRAPRSLLDTLLNVYPAGLDYDTLAERSGYSRTSSSFSNALGTLRSLDLVSGYGNVVADEIFFEGAA